MAKTILYGPHNLYATTKHIHRNKISNRKFFNLYLRLLDAFIDEVVTVGAQLYDGGHIIKVNKVDRWASTNPLKPRTHAIDWPATAELKKQLIEEGVKIKSKENPDGENYFVFFLTDYYFNINAYTPSSKVGVINSSSNPTGFVPYHKFVEFYRFIPQINGYFKDKIKSFIKDPTHRIHQNGDYKPYKFKRIIEQGF